MPWHVEIPAEAEAEIDALPADMRARFLRIAALLEELGPQHVREPHVKHLEDKLWERRMTGRDGIARAMYCTAQERRLIVVRAFVKKTQKTPRRAIESAQRRMRAWQ